MSPNICDDIAFGIETWAPASAEATKTCDKDVKGRVWQIIST